MLLIMSCVQNIFYKINDNSYGTYSNEVQNMKKIRIHGVLCIYYGNPKDPMRWNVCFCTIKIYL